MQRFLPFFACLQIVSNALADGGSTSRPSRFSNPQTLPPLAISLFARYSPFYQTRFTNFLLGFAPNGFGLRVNGSSVQEWLTASSLARRTAEALLRVAGRRHLAHWDCLVPARCQTRILLGLLHRAQTTHFGRDHDFRRIRSVADYRRLVPLSTRAELWRDYWQPVYPHLAGATWPGPMTNGRADASDSAHLTPPSSELQAAHRAALYTAFALAGHVRPRTRLLAGTLLFVADEGPSNRTERAILDQRLPALIRPFTEASAEIVAEPWANQSVSVLLGPAERLLSLMEQIKQRRGKRSLRDVWPQLSAILYTRRPSSMPAARLCAEVGEDVLLLEMTGRAEGPIAVEDPRFGLPHLLFDHGVYFEFVPPAQAGEPRCPRFGIDEIELGVSYELAVTSPAGLWACRIGRTVCLEQHDPPLLRFVETTAWPSAAPDSPRRTRRTDLVLPTPALPAPHPRSAGTPAAPSENAFHTPWSVRADRG
jgi:hypothetical protein